MGRVADRRARRGLGDALFNITLSPTGAGTMSTWKRRIATLGLLLSGCDPHSSPPTTVFDLDRASQVADGVAHLMTVRGAVRADLVADSAYSFERQSRVEFAAVRATLHNERGVEVGTLTSRRADFHSDSRLLIAHGDVELITGTPEAPRILRTEELYYDPRSDRVWAEVPFTLQEEGRTTRGTSFRTDSNFRNWELLGVEVQGLSPHDVDG